MAPRPDVIVVGAGPAGAAAAWTLARSGARVTLVDASHPREKPCGGGVTGRALALVRDAIDVNALTAAVVETVRFAASADRAGVAVPLDAAGVNSGSSMVVVSRAEFDAHLLQAARQAGADLIEARVTDVIAHRSAVEIRTSSGTQEASFAIGADGANSLVRRRVLQPFRRDQLSIATGFFAHGVTSREVVVEIGADPPGYIWSFPRRTHLAIGICAQADAGVRAETLRARTAAWIRGYLAECARLEPYSWPIPSLSGADLSRLPVSGPRWCLAGDAAGLVDPMTREGIFFAIQSGVFAAEAARSSEPAREYSARINDAIVPELRYAARMKDAFFRPGFTKLLIQALRRSAAVRSVMADLIAGRQSYATLRWRLIKTLELPLAWRC